MNWRSPHFMRRAGWVFLIAPCLLAGCSSFRSEMGRPLWAKAHNFTEGRTQLESVLHEVGPPNQVTQLPEGFAFLYEHSLMSEFQLGLSLNLPIIHWFKFLQARNRLDQEVMVLAFDNQGTLRSAGYSSWKEGLGGGGGVQFLFSVMSLSDISNILRPGEAHDWGKALLQSPPVGLNSAQSLRTGQHGFEQRIAPAYAGQHTLEMTSPKTEKQKKKIKKDYMGQHENPL